MFRRLHKADILYWIYDISTASLAALISLVCVAFSWLGTLLISPLVRVRGRLWTNEIVGYLLSSFGVLYGLLLGLVAVAAYQNFADVEANVSREAASLDALYQDVSTYPEPHGQNLRWLLRDYTRYVIKYAWPLQRNGLIPAGGIARVNAFQERLLAFEPRTTGEGIMHAETLRQFNKFLEHRNDRLQSVNTSIPAILWYVVLLGGVLNIAVFWLFDMNLPTHLLLGGLFAFFLGAVITLIAAMDNPFRGEVSVGPDAFEHLYWTKMRE